MQQQAVLLLFVSEGDVQGLIDILESKKLRDFSKKEPFHRRLSTHISDKIDRAQSKYRYSL